MKGISRPETSTIVFFHAHPDDEAISTGGTMALAAAAGHRVVLVVATRGEEGLYPDGFLAAGESLGERRSDEQAAAARILGVARLEFLGYRDSGMMGWDQNGDPDCFWQADVAEAAGRLAAILREERADVLTAYDDHGGYGHPDHIQVHRVGHEAAAMAGTNRVFEATISREKIRGLRRSVWTGQASGLDDAVVESMGTPESDISTVIDVREVLATKRAAMAAHASQITADSWFLRRGEDAVDDALGFEWFRRVVPRFEGILPGDRESDLFGSGNG